MTTRTPSARERLDRLGRRLLDRIGDGDHDGHAPVDRRVERGLALRPQRVCLPGEGCRERAVALHEAPAADGDPAPADVAA